MKNANEVITLEKESKQYRYPEEQWQQDEYNNKVLIWKLKYVFWWMQRQMYIHKKMEQDKILESSCLNLKWIASFKQNYEKM